jgi:hypothetical protein
MLRESMRANEFVCDRGTELPAGDNDCQQSPTATIAFPDCSASRSSAEPMNENSFKAGSESQVGCTYLWLCKELTKVEANGYFCCSSINRYS